MNKLKLVSQLIGYFGVSWTIFRVSYAIKVKSGWYKRRFPTVCLDQSSLALWLKQGIPTTTQEYFDWRCTNHPLFFFDAVPHLPTSDALITKAEAILAGCWPYFQHAEFQLGMPPVWNKNPLSGQTVPIDKHWSEISDFDSGDIKYIWEPNRFSVVFTLVRAFAVTRDPKYANTFWALVDDWALKNPPQMGPNWKCGQEASFRVMAWCFGLYAFIEYGRPEQLITLVALIALHGDRIEGNIGYAISQNNNHGISEAVGLLTIGILFPELKQAGRWVARGKNVLESEVARQFFEDGTYAQYSPNYQRVALHDVIWAVRLCEINNIPVAKTIYDKVRKAAAFLLEILDHESGCVPNHASNDSALVLPLNDLDPGDFRPIIQAAMYLENKQFQYFDTVFEDIRWLFSHSDEQTVSRKIEFQPSSNFAAPDGGFYSLRSADSWMMIHCADYNARPHHADQLHVDFWWRGINLCCDAGTYLYNGDAYWQNGLKITGVHNTVTVDELDQMTPYSRFLWLDWARGAVHFHDEQYWEGAHNGYSSRNLAVSHRRAVYKAEDYWLIADELTGQKPHNFRLHWLIPDMPYQIIRNRIELDTAKGHFFITLSQPAQIRQASPANQYGWRSINYGSKERAISLSASIYQQNEAIFWTVLSPYSVSIGETQNKRLVMNNRGFVLGGQRLIEADPV